jgi:hypothetical protein
MRADWVTCLGWNIVVVALFNTLKLEESPNLTSGDPICLDRKCSSTRQCVLRYVEIVHLKLITSDSLGSENDCCHDFRSHSFKKDIDKTRMRKGMVLHLEALYFFIFHWLSDFQFLGFN